MSRATVNKMSSEVIGASLFVPSTARGLYEVLFDVQSFPSWAPGVRRVEVLEGAGEPGMISEWEVSIFGMKKKILSVLEEAESPTFLRWTYDGLVRGWGQCAIKGWGDGTLAEFHTELHPLEPILGKLMRMPATKGAASRHLKRCLARLGRVVSGDDPRIRVGPPEGRLGSW
ncbi:MAG TPA: SRPBCC family protein [Rubrobacteraceae bacterium]|nr:SRPBCC family protein [Rubrobacteraceae bacterium]